MQVLQSERFQQGYETD